MLTQALRAEEAGVCLSEWRNLVCGAMIVILPLSLSAQESGRAILRNAGGVWLNGNSAPNSAPLFPYDLVQTQKASIAKIDAEGSTATIHPESMVQFEGDDLMLDHGGIEVETARAMKVRVNCMTAIPLTAQWTRYEITDLDGRVTLAAVQGDVKLHFPGAALKHSKSGALADVIVHQGERLTRDERCGPTTSPAEPGKAGFLDSFWAKVAGGAVIATTCILICRGDDPISPDKP
jgi:hypothetical protein